MKNKRILVFTLLMSALLVFSAMPAYSADDEVNFAEPEFYVAESVTFDSNVADDTNYAVADPENLDLLTADDFDKGIKFEEGTEVENVTDLISGLLSRADSVGKKLTELSFKGLSITVATIDLSSATDLTTFNMTGLTTVKTIKLPASLTILDATGSGLTELTANAKMASLVLNQVTSLTKLDVKAAGTKLLLLALDGASSLTTLDLSENTAIENLSLYKAGLTELSLTANVNIKIVNISYLTAAGEGKITLPTKAESLEALDIQGNQFALLNGGTDRFPLLTAAKFLGSDQNVDRKDLTTVPANLIFTVMDLFPSSKGYQPADDSSVDLTKIKSITAYDENGNKLATVTNIEDGQVNFEEVEDATKIASLSYVYDTGNGDLTVAASGVTGEEDSGNSTVGGSGGGCSAGFGALALAAVAAFLLKKSR